MGSTTTKRGNASRHIVPGERKSIKIAEPIGNKSAAVDLGINILASVVTEDGRWIIYRGARAKSDFFYFIKKIGAVQSWLDRHRDKLFDDAAEELGREIRRLYALLKRRLRHLYRTVASHLVRKLHSLGVSRVYVGYPYNIAQERGSKLVTNMWSYRELVKAIELKAQEYGIEVHRIVEYGTSKRCALHGAEVVRRPRGVVTCPLGHRLHSDLNGALNILKIGTGAVPTAGKSESYLVTHNGVAPVKWG